MSKSSGRLYYKHNRVKQLRAFCYTAQSGSISKAAERMFLSQPSVSLQVQALERELGVALFERRGPKIKMTPDGDALYEIALPLLEGIDSLPEHFAAKRNRLDSGRLDIAAGESTTLYILPKLLEEFTKQYPGIKVKLHNITGRDVLSVIRQDEVDFAVGSMLDIPDDIIYQAVYSYGQSLITPKDHPLARKPTIRLEDLCDYPLIMPPRHLTTWRIVNLIFQQHNIPYDVALEVGGWEIIKKYVTKGFGISIASNVCLTEDDELASRSLGQYFPDRTYGVILRQGKFLSPQARKFIELMKPGFFKGSENPASIPETSSNVFVPPE